MELFQLVDRNGAPAGEATREQCHGNPRLIHLVVHLHVFDAGGKLYLQKRAAAKDTNPGRWDTSVGGHVHAGEDVRDALIREAREELDIDAGGASFLYAYLFQSPFESEYARCYVLTWTGPLRPDPAEIETGRFYTVAEIDAAVGTGMLTPLFEREWPRLTSAVGPGGGWSRQ